MRHATPLAVAAALLVAAPAAQAAPNYPNPGKPGAVQKKPKGPFKTLSVGKGKKYKTIQKAIDAAKPGDTVKVANGTYKEGVIIRGASKRFVKLVGNAKDPSKVVLEAKGIRGTGAQNGVLINGADGVTVQGFRAQHQKGNGFFVVNVTGYMLRDLEAILTGVYGIYAFNSKGGTMRDSVGAWNNDAGFYIGQTPPQSKPIRSLVTNVQAYGNVTGFSGTNMRYVTITKSKWFNNGLGIVPNALDSEKFAPPEDNVITDNDIFWNNFNYFDSAPYPLRRGATGDVAYPVGTGILLFGGRRHTISNNRIFGHYLMGSGAVKQILLKQADAQDLVGNQTTGNAFGKNGTDLNGRDMFYDGSGSGNCFGSNTGVAKTVPEDGSTFSPCPFAGANPFNQAAQTEAVNWTIGDPTHEKFWIKTPHAPIAGLTPLEHYDEYTGTKPK